MNLHLYRLVFSRRHGTLVAVAEHTRAGGKRASGEGSRARASVSAVLGVPATTALAGALALLLGAPPTAAQTRAPVVFASRAAAPAAKLPVPYGRSGVPATTPRPFVYDPAKGSGSADLEASGRVQWSVVGNQATFNQGSEARVVVNWDSFNIRVLPEPR